jgi:acetyl-CoA C-acetyltransferase
MGAGEAPKGPDGRRGLDLTHSGAVWSGPIAFAKPA